MPGLDPGTHPPSEELFSRLMDGRDKPGHDENGRLTTLPRPLVQHRIEGVLDVADVGVLVGEVLVMCVH
jgi:hypothetical protein